MSKQGPINPDIQRQTIEALLTEPGAAVEKCLKPEFLHLAPPLHTARDEVSYIINFLSHYHNPILHRGSGRNLVCFT